MFLTMLHQDVIHVDIPSIEMDGENFSDEALLRSMIHRLVGYMSLDELKKIFRMTKLDPREPWPNSVPLSEAERIKREILAQLQRQQVVQFEVSIVTQD